MPDFLRDPVWQFVGVVLALAASVVLFLLQRRRKALSYEVVSRTSLMSVKEEVKGRVQILFDGTPVSDAHMMIMRVTNAGNVPIVPSDYLRPVKFGFGEMVQILSAEVMETSPHNIEASVEVDTGAVILTPVLLNGGDSITLKILLAQYEGKIDVDGRIVGVKHVQTARENLLPYVAMVIGMVMAMGGVFTSPRQVSGQEGLAVAAVGYVLMFVGVFSDRRYRTILLRVYRYFRKAFARLFGREMEKTASSSVEAILQDMNEVHERAARAEETTVVQPLPPTHQTVFEDDFRSGLGGWMGMNNWEPSVTPSRGVVLLNHIVDTSRLSRVLCREEPFFVDGAIECEVYLEQGAVFDLLLRGNLAVGEFYMARLDARPTHWDCILFKPEGRRWRECNKDKGTLISHSPPNQWLPIRVEAEGSRISVFRDGQLIDQIDDARVTTSRICVFAELANVYVRKIRISLAEYS